MIGREDVDALRDALLAGGVALVPTDTVYGLAAALDSPAGVDRLYALKGRPRDQPCQVIVLGPQLDEVIASAPSGVRRVLAELLPGPVTCIIPDPAGRFAAASGGRPGSVGVRAPVVDGPLVDLGLPLVATSANDPGGRDPARVEDVPADIRAGLDAVLDAGTLPGTASAVLDLRDAETGRAMLIRPGPDAASVLRKLEAAGIHTVA